MREDVADLTRLYELIKQARDFGAADGRQAIRPVRRPAAESGVAPDRIGIMGFSAGGYVTLGAAYEHDAESRPDFAAPLDPAPYQNSGVPEDAPPPFLAWARDDGMAVGASLPEFTAWRDAGRPV
jgi:acetyl esterase/lipase